MIHLIPTVISIPTLREEIYLARKRRHGNRTNVTLPTNLDSSIPLHYTRNDYGGTIYANNMLLGVILILILREEIHLDW